MSLPLPEMDDKILLHSSASNPSRKETVVFSLTDIAPWSLDTSKSGFKLEGAAEVERKFLEGCAGERERGREGEMEGKVKVQQSAALHSLMYRREQDTQRRRCKLR